METFSANSEHLAGWDCHSVGVWGVQNGARTVTMEVWHVRCLAVSNDGRWIAAGTFYGDTLVWDASTGEQVFAHKKDNFNEMIFGVDFSPDSTRLVTASMNDTAIVWDIATGKQVQTLDHDDWVKVAKYSPQGDRIATATDDSVRVWDSIDGHLLVDIPVRANTGLLWFHNHLFVLQYTFS